MKYALAGLGFVNANLDYNKNIIIRTMKDLSNEADMLIFGEAFLQGFYSLDFKSESDFDMAIAIEDPIINDIRNAASNYGIGVSFGFYELDSNIIYSSQITIGKKGEILDLFRRVSPGWKEKYASNSYREGEGFHSFDFFNQKIGIGLCGDLRFEENIEKINKLNADLIFWPVYTDYSPKDWNDEIKFEYMSQAKRVCTKVLYVNSYCLDRKDEAEIAKAGTAYFLDGKIEKEIPSGKEGILLIDIGSDNGDFDGK